MTVVSYLLVAYKSNAHLDTALDAIVAQEGDFEREVVVVDNSPEESCATLILRRIPAAHFVINKRNLGYTAALNQALRIATGDYLFLLNPDVELSPNCTQTMLLEFADSTVWAVAPQLRDGDGGVQPSVRNFPNFATLLWEFSGLSRLLPQSPIFGRWRNRYFDYRARAVVEQPMASAFLLSRESFDRLGEWDERFFVFFSDVDYCKRVCDAAGQIIFLPDAHATHQIGGSTRQEGSWLIYESHRSFYRYLAKHELKGVGCLLRPFAASLLAVGAVVRALLRRLSGRLF